MDSFDEGYSASSARAGRRRALSERRVRRQTETGGKNASVVLADADVEPAAPGFRFDTRLKTAAVRFAW